MPSAVRQLLPCSPSHHSSGPDPSVPPQQLRKVCSVLPGTWSMWFAWQPEQRPPAELFYWHPSAVKLALASVALFHPNGKTNGKMLLEANFVWRNQLCRSGTAPSESSERRKWHSHANGWTFAAWWREARAQELWTVMSSLPSYAPRWPANVRPNATVSLTITALYPTAWRWSKWHV